MGYLIIQCKESGQVLSATKHALAQPMYEYVRAKLTAMFPGHDVFDPLTSCPGGRIMIVYTSRQKNGVGRSGSQFTLWAVKARVRVEQQLDYLPRSPQRMPKALREIIEETKSRQRAGDLDIQGALLTAFKAGVAHDVDRLTNFIDGGVKHAFKLGMERAAEIVDKHTVPEAGQIAEDIRQEISKNVRA